MALPELLMRPRPRVLVDERRRRRSSGGGGCRSCLDLIATTVPGSTSTDGVRPGEALRAELGDLLRYDLPALLGAPRAMEEA